jgi:Fe-S-cluster containining protein
MKKPFPVPVRVRYSCDKCPAYCCTYSDIEVGVRDIERLAKHFGTTFAKAEARFTKMDSEGKVKILRHKKDTIFDSSCMFLDSEKRRCTIYEVRPGTCRKYPQTSSCGYYDFLRFERTQQDNKDYIALT